MTTTFDTSGAVDALPLKGSDLDPGAWLWSDLSPFTQGYIEALFAASVDPRARMMMPRDGRYASAPRERRAVAFSDLAPEALARIIADCEAYRPEISRQVVGYGRQLWAARQAGFVEGFPPLTVQLGDDGKVRFA